jgi:hypothetical protein
MKLYHWAGQPKQYRLERLDYYAYQLWFGSHVWRIHFACRCMPCRLTRRRAFFKKWFHIELTDQDLEDSAKLYGQRSLRKMREILTQARFRAAQKEQEPK